MHILGIDVSKATLDVALSTDNRTYAMNDFSNDGDGYQALVKWLKAQGVKTLHACLEATGRYSDGVALFLAARGYRVSLVNPAQVHAHAASQLRRNKDDALDAQLLADFCFKHEPPYWTPPTPLQRECKELSRYLTSLKREKTRKLNQLAAHPTSALLRQSLEKGIGLLDEEIAHIAQALENRLRSEETTDENLDLLLSIPSIGRTTACILLAEVDFSQFAQASHLAAYAGLVPRHHTSGSSVHKRPRLSKIGNRFIRTALYMPALSAHRFNPIVADLRARLLERGKSKMTVLAAVMRKLLHLAFGVLKTRKPFDPHHHLHSIPVAG